MILVDTSIWIDHFRYKRDDLSSALLAGQVMTHPFILGELALGSLQKRHSILEYLADLPSATHAEEDEVRLLIDRHALFGTGIGYIDAHLLASAQLSRVPLWTQDKRLHNVASKLGLVPA